MIKVIVLFSILAGTTNTNWKTVDISEKVTIELPDNYMKIDTLGVVVYGGTTDFSFFSFIASPKDALNSYKNNKELIDMCDEMIDGFLSRIADPNVLSKVEYQLNDVNSRKVEFRYDYGGKMVHCISIFFFVDDTPYTLMVQSEKMLECSKDFKRLASSIQCKK